MIFHSSKLVCVRYPGCFGLMKWDRGYPFLYFLKSYLYSTLFSFLLCAVLLKLQWAGASFVAVRGLFIAVASLIAERKLEVHRLWSLQHVGSGVVAHGLSSLWHVQSFRTRDRILCSLHWQGGFLSNGPPGKSLPLFLILPLPWLLRRTCLNSVYLRLYFISYAIAQFNLHSASS